MSNTFEISKNAEGTYSNIRECIITAQNKVSQAVNSAMVMAYWEIGKQIYEVCDENERAEYGTGLLNFLSDKLTAEFGRGFDASNLRKMRQFYCTFQNRDTVCPELSWSHYRRLMRIANDEEREFYTTECANSMWSVRQLERQINTMFYQRLLAIQDKTVLSEEIQKTESKAE